MLSIRFLFESCRIVRGSECAACHAAEHEQKQCCRHKRASPYQIVNQARITFPAHEPHCKQTQRAGINVPEKTRRRTDRRPKHIAAKRSSWYAVDMLQQASREKR